MAEKEYIDLYECRDDFYATVLDILSEDNTNDRANQIIDAFDCLPVADVEPVRHGHWTEIDHSENFGDYHFVCSECKCNTPDRAYVVAPDFCPKKKKKMDGEENERKR